MMDLAKIRKKARSSKKNSAEGLPERDDGVVSKSGQGLPECSVSETPVSEQKDVRPKTVASSSRDLLDAFFDANPEMDALFAGQDLHDHLMADEAGGESLRQWLCFSLGKEEYAIDISDIREIVKPREITDIPRVPEFILGIISLRGIIIPIFDLKKRLQLGVTSVENDSRIIVCQLKDRVVGLLVDRIAQVVRIPEEAIEPPPAILSGVDRDFVEGVGRSQDRMMILLCLTNVLDAELA